MKLHLGAGRIILPVASDKQPAHLHPMPPACFEGGWVNIDKFAGVGIQEEIDLFQFPWIRSSNDTPFNPSSIDEIYATHFVEHIPHQVSVSKMIPLNWRKQYLEAAANLDGWFMFFRECHRILKPDGLIYIICPYALSFAAITDPSHTRMITPNSFDYLVPNPNAPFDYHADCHFVRVGAPDLRYTSDWLEESKKEGMTVEAMMSRAITYFNVCDEIRVTLRAVK